MPGLSDFCKFGTGQAPENPQVTDLRSWPRQLFTGTSEAETETHSSFPELVLLPAEEERVRWEREDAKVTERPKEAKNTVTKQSRKFRAARTEPIPMARPTTSSVAPLHELAQQRKVAIKFDLKGVGESAFIGELQIQKKNFRTIESYSSKKGAKEAVATLGLEYLKNLPVEAIIPKPRASTCTPESGYVVKLQIEAQK
jgi:hypothetical protein